MPRTPDRHILMRPLVTACLAVLMLISVAASTGAQTMANRDDWENTVPADVPQDMARWTELRDLLTNNEALIATRDPRAIPIQRQAVRLSEEVWGPDHPVTALRLVGLAELLGSAGGEADTLNRRALSIYERRMGEARSPRNIAQLSYYVGLADGTAPAEAERLLRQAARLYEAQNSDMTPNVVWSLCGVLQQNGKLEDALRIAREYAERMAARAPSNVNTARAQWFYAQVLNRATRPAEAAIQNTLAQRTMTAFWAGADQTQRGLWREVATGVLGVGFDQAAGDNEQRARRLLSAAANPDAIDPDWRTTLQRYATDATQAGRHADAANAYRQELLFRTAANDAPRLRASVSGVYGNALMRLERWDDAEQPLRDAAAYWRSVSDRGNAIIFTADLADVLANRGRFRDAAAQFDLVIREATSVGEPSYLAHWRTRQAQLLLRMDMNAEAASAALASMRIYQRSLGSGVTTARATRRGGAQLARFSAALAARALWEQTHGALSAQQARDLFEAMQTLGASDASDALAAGAARIAAGRAGLGPAAAEWLAAQDRVATAEARALELLNGPSADPALLAAVTAERTAAERNRDAQETTLRTFPDFFQLITPAPATLRETQAALGPGEALILLSQGGDAWSGGPLANGFVVAVTREQVAFAEIPLAPDALTAAITAVRASLQGPGGRSPGAAGRPRAPPPQTFNRTRARALYDALFAAPQIARLIASKERWTLAPQRVLLSTPFAALVSAPFEGPGETADPAQLRATHWLGLEHVLAITPSVSALLAQRRPRPPTEAPTPFFGVGDPVFNGAPDAERAMQTASYFRNNLANVTQLRELSRLPRTGPEIVALATALGATANDYVLGEAATETEIMRRARNGALGRADVIAFATHGLVAGALENQAEPALALTPPAVASAADDGLLTASEAARLTLTARWVILSACDTAAGGRPDAEGLSGLARAFFYAGARTLLVSQWPVDDAAAEQLTTQAVLLQRNATRPISAAAAMRESMRRLAREDFSRDDPAQLTMAHPRVWAPFILVSGE